MKSFRINFVEFDEIMEHKYQPIQNETILTSIGGNQLKKDDAKKLLVVTDAADSIGSGDVGLLSGDNG